MARDVDLGRFGQGEEAPAIRVLPAGRTMDHEAKHLLSVAADRLDYLGGRLNESIAQEIREHLTS